MCNRKPEVNEFDAPRARVAAPGIERVSDDVPFDSAGGLSFQYQFPVDARICLQDQNARRRFRRSPKIFEERMPVKAGTRSVAVTFLADNAVPEVIAPFRSRESQALPGRRLEPSTGSPRKMDLRLDGARVKLFDVAGAPLHQPDHRRPLRDRRPGDSPSREKIFVCQPVVRQRRRPLRPQDSLRLWPPCLPPAGDRCRPEAAAGFLQPAAREGNFDSGIEMALAGHAGFARFPVPRRARPRRRRAGQRLPHQRFRTGLAAVVLPLEQHSGRRTAAIWPSRAS